MEDLNKVENEVVTTTTEETTDPIETVEEQNVLKDELDKVQKKTSGRTEREKALFAKKKIEERLKMLDEDEGINSVDSTEDDDTPVTVGTLRKLEKQKSQVTALTMAEDITDTDEQELVKHHIQNTIRPSGNPAEDLKNARAIVNAVKNKQILEEIRRKTPAKSTSSGSGAPAKTETIFEPTQEEQTFMKAPFSLTKEQILEARKKAEK